MAYPLALKEKAINLRKKGFSLKEISEKLNIAKSTASVWLQNINLNKKAQKRLENRKILGQYKSQLLKREKRKKLLKKYANKATERISKIKFDKNTYKLLCAFLYWCEGVKTSDTHVRFTNSEPAMIATFLDLLRKSFELDEKKFRALIHLHDYHNEQKQKRLWSKITKIPLSQFNRSYRKPNTGKRKRNDYPGCITISYYDHSVAKELLALYNMFAKRSGGVALIGESGCLQNNRFTGSNPVAPAKKCAR